MVVQTFTFLLVVVSVAVHRGHALMGVNVEVSPKWGVSRTLPDAYNIKCVPTGLAGKAKQIRSLQLQKQGNSAPIVELVNGSPAVRISKDSKYMGDGELDIKNSFLSLTVKNPSSEDGGNYNCIVQYMNQNGDLNTIMGTGHLDVDTYVFSNSIKKVENQLTALEAKLKTQTAKDAAADIKITDLEATIRVMKEKENAVTAFSASNNDSRYKLVKGAAMRFSNVITSIGGGYDKSTGVFTAPTIGLYSFQLTVTTKSVGTTYHFYLKVNKSKTLANLIAGDVRFHDQSSVSSVVKLNAGDTVQAEIGRLPRGIDYTRGEWTLFSGYLIKVL